MISKKAPLGILNNIVCVRGGFCAFPCFFNLVGEAQPCQSIFLRNRAFALAELCREVY